MRTALFALGLLACGGEPEPATTTHDPPTLTDNTPSSDTGTTHTTPTSDCAAVIVAVTPAPNNELTPVDTEVSITFNEAITPADAWKVELEGVPGTSALAADGLSASFVPDTPLTEDTDYTVLAAVCMDSQEASFHTLPPAMDATLVDGVSYSIPYSDLVITEPQNSVALDIIIAVDYVVVQATQVDEVNETLYALAATAYEDGYGGVDLDCAAAIDAGLVDFSLNPFFTMGPTTLLFSAGATAIRINEFELLGEFTPDGSAMEDVALSGLIDLSTKPSGISCNVAAALAKGTCVKCTPTSNSSECLIFEATAPSAAADPQFDIQGTCFQ